jgi:hypothetical protein
MTITKESSIKKCEECGKTIRGRLDKRFCDANCRNSFNNKLKRGDEQYILNTNRRLRKNRRILKTLSPIGKSTVRQEVLDAMGYDFNIFSSMFRSKQGLIYYLCYDYGFSPIIDAKNINKALIINRQEYMVNWQPWKYVKQ